jgi:hypothetical protein
MTLQKADLVLRKPVLILLCSALSAAVGCGGASSKKTNTIVTTGSNVAPLVVNAGPAASSQFSYVNGAFTSVQVCVPSTSTCQTISGILVDTGSSGLRILSSALTVSLPQQNGSGGSPVIECLPFISAYAWGPVQTADVQIASETASAVPIQVIGGTSVPAPSSCSDFGGTPLTPVDTLSELGANGILGVGLALQDCGEQCTETGSSNPGLYYLCPNSSCSVTTESLAAQVPNPVSLFATDNNGVVIELPQVNGGAATLSGSLVFGIGTESNNALGSATVYTTDDFGNFTTEFNNQTYSSSFLDSGSNGLYFLDNGIPLCSDDQDFFCPSSVDNFSATNTGNTEGSGSVSFSIGNADTLFNTGDAALSQLGGPNSAGMFDWGLPFFYGRNVYTAIEQKSTPGGSGPYWAY